MDPKIKATRHHGSCHCGAVQYEVEIDPSQGGRCNCSVCTKISPTSGMVKPDAFQLKAGEDALSTYVWGAKISTRYFCKHCGVHTFGRGHLAELGGDFVGINLNTLDDFDPGRIEVGHWDGRHDNWGGGMRTSPWPISP